MTTRRSYETESIKLAKAAELAIESFEKLGLEQFEKTHVDHLVKCYTEWRNDILNPEPKFKNLASLKYHEQDIFTYFQEASGPVVELFWSKLKDANLSYTRENKLMKVLKRGKIKNRIEFDLVVDLFVPAHQNGMITEEQAASLSEMIQSFERRNQG